MRLTWALLSTVFIFLTADLANAQTAVQVLHVDGQDAINLTYKLTQNPATSIDHPAAFEFNYQLITPVNCSTRDQSAETSLAWHCRLGGARKRFKPGNESGDLAGITADRLSLKFAQLGAKVEKIQMWQEGLYGEQVLPYSVDRLQIRWRKSSATSKDKRLLQLARSNFSLNSFSWKSWRPPNLEIRFIQKLKVLEDLKSPPVRGSNAKSALKNLRNSAASLKFLHPTLTAPMAITFKR